MPTRYRVYRAERVFTCPVINYGERLKPIGETYVLLSYAETVCHNRVVKIVVLTNKEIQL